MEHLLTEAEIKKLKSAELELMDELDRICRENNIQYYMFGGTLLGAVRHGGFIPWDDDIDVAMFRSDLEKFIDISKDALKDNYFLQTDETDKYYPLMTAKLRKNNTIFEESCMVDDIKSHIGVFIDIFPIDEISSLDDQAIIRKTKKLGLLNTVLCENLGYHYGIKFKTRLLAKVLRLVGIDRLKRIRYKLMTNENGKGYNNTTVYASNYGYKKQFKDKGIYEPPCELEFEGRKYYAPGRYKEWLNQLYGPDYMEWPPIEKRVTRHPIKRIDFGDEK